MASTIALKRRITSIKGTRQITKAMELVSASKLRRAQEQAQRSRPYGDMATAMLQRLNTMGEVERQPLFKKRPVNSRLYIVITSNTGLAGAYNANILKHLTTNLARDIKEKSESHVIAVGSKGAHFARNLQNVKLEAVYPPFGDQPTANDVRPILNTIIDMYISDQIDEIYILYTHFQSTISQIAVDKQLLPAPAPEAVVESATPSNFEPDVETVIEQVTTRLIEAQIWQAILESSASEHAMRMMATKNATDNANELIDDYTLELNTARQAAITQELAEISGGAEALAN